MAAVIFRLLQLVPLQVPGLLPAFQDVCRDGDPFAGKRGAVEVKIDKLHIPAQLTQVQPRDGQCAPRAVPAGILLQIVLGGGPDDRGAESQGKGAYGHDGIYGQIVFKEKGRPVRPAVILQGQPQRFVGKAGMPAGTACPEALLRRLSGAPHGDGEPAQLAQDLKKPDVVFPGLGNAVIQGNHACRPLFRFPDDNNIGRGKKQRNTPRLRRVSY